MSQLISSLSSIFMIIAPILITAVGGMICERSGVVNIALEGLMSIGAFTAATIHVLMESAGFGSWDIIIALLGAAVISCIFTVIHAYSAITLNADQTISGTGLNLLATGVTLFASQIIFHADRTQPFQIGMLTLPSGFYPTFYIAIAVVFASWFMMYKTRLGLRLRACGEHPDACASVGINVIGIRYFATLLSGFLAGLAGGCLVLTNTIQYTANTVNGAGFIALAAVAFGRWKPKGVTLSSSLFGVSLALSVIAKDIFPGINKILPSEFFNILPYVITLLALVIFSGKNYAPAADGKPYVKGAS
ncbi:MAG: ABC transporter permease [Treponema sp.]|nr:ABC transporter permease [Treponema sp.]